MVKPHYGYAKRESAVKRKLREYKKEVAKGNFETQDSYMLFQDYCLDWLNSVYKNKVIVTTFSERMRTIPFKSKAIEVIEKIIKIQQKLGITSNRISWFKTYIRNIICVCWSASKCSFKLGRS